MIEKFRNNLGAQKGAIILTKYFKDCETQEYAIGNRNYHVGLNSLLECDIHNSVHVDNVLVLAEGLSPRWVLMR